MPNEKSQILNLKDFKFFGSKLDGMHKGGVYQFLDHKYMVKTMDMKSTLAELIGSKVAKLIAGDSVPETYLVLDNKKVHLASKYIEDFSTLYEYARDHNIPDACFPHGCVIKQDGSIEHINAYILDALSSDHKKIINIPNSEEVELAIEFVNHGDTKDRNRGIIKTDDENILAAIVDFSESLKFDKDPLTSIKNNYIPQRMLVALNKITSITAEELSKVLDDSFAELKECYPNEIEYLQKTQERLKEDLLDRQQKFEAYKNKVEHEQDIIEFIISRKKGDVEKSEQLLSKIKEKLDDTSDRFKILLVEHTPEDAKALNILSTITDTIWWKGKLNKAIEEGDIKNFKSAISDITNQKVLGTILEEAIEKGNKEIFDLLLPKATEQHYLSVALRKSIEKGNQEIFDLLLPKMTEQNDLDLALKEAAEKGNQEVFDLLLPRVKGQDALGEGLISAIKGGNKEAFLILLPKVTKQNKLNWSLATAVLYNNIEAFDALLPKVDDQSYLGIALRKAGENNNQKMVNMLLPIVTEQGALGQIFMSAARKNDKDLINILLPKVTSDYVFACTLKEAVQNNNKEVFDLLLVKVNDKDICQILEDPLLYSESHVYMAKALLSRVTDQKTLNNALDKIDQSTEEGKKLAAIISPPTIYQKATEFLGQTNEFLKQHDLLKIPVGVEAVETPSHNKGRIAPTIDNLVITESSRELPTYTSEIGQGLLHLANLIPGGWVGKIGQALGFTIAKTENIQPIKVIPDYNYRDISTREDIPYSKVFERSAAINAKESPMEAEWLEVIKSLSEHEVSSKSKLSSTITAHSKAKRNKKHSRYP